MAHLKYALFGLLLLGIIVHGSSYIRFANTKLADYSRLGLATQSTGVITALDSAPYSYYPLPISPYQSLSQLGLPINDRVGFYVHDLETGENTAFVNATLVDNQSYTFVAAGSSLVPLKLFSVEERPSNPASYTGKAALKIINAVESTYFSWFTIDIFIGSTRDSPQIPFGTSSDFLVYNVSSVFISGDLDNHGTAFGVGYLPLERGATTFLYLRGTNGTDFSWNSYVVPFSGPVVDPPVPIASPVAPPVNNTTPVGVPPVNNTTPVSVPPVNNTTPVGVPPVNNTTPVSVPPVNNTTPVSVLQTAQIRLINCAYDPDYYLEAVMHTEYYQYTNANSSAFSSFSSSDNIFGEYITVPSNASIRFVIEDYGLSTTLVLPTNSRSSLVFFNSGNDSQPYSLIYLNETPVRTSYPADPRSYNYRVVNTRQGDTLDVYTLYWYSPQSAVNFGSYGDFESQNMTVQSRVDYYSRYLSGGSPDTLTTYYIVGRVGSYSSFYLFTDQTQLPPPINQGPSCVNGYVETTGYCNCYSGFANDDNYPNAKCTLSPPYWCPSPVRNLTSTDSGPVPSLSNLHVTRSNLGLTVNSAFVGGNRRTLIEFSNSACNLINNSSYYSKSVSSCSDQIDALIPFTTCGFTRTSNEDAEFYRGEVHVKHVDYVQVGDSTVERVIDTPITIVIRLPKNIAIESSVEVIAAPIYTVPLSAALVSQRVDTTSQTAQLVYATSVPAQFIIQDAQLGQRPSGVNATVHFTSTNCTSSFCLQYLVVDLRIGNCEISGFYRLDVSIVCRNQSNCPADVQEAPVRATIASNIIAQSSCGDASVDVGLQGSLKAYDSLSFDSQSLAFATGQPAYFLVNTFSSDVVIANVTLDQVYYQGPNVAGHFLLTGGTNVSSRAARNNFTWRQLSSSQLWFSFDVSVSKLFSSEDTMFKLDNGQSGVYSFMAVVDVEWVLDGTPIANAPIRKRMLLQSTVSQGSQLSTQIQITDSSVQQPASTDNGSVSTGTTLAGLLSLLVTVASLVVLHI